ncbi:MAG: YbjN domain-containing protein [Rhodopirellula sp.]|nr:YbjN domain-containing protein [Rhodopirellula sp.]
MNSFVRTWITFVAGALIVLSGSLSSATAGIEQDHPYAGFAISVPDGWMVSRSSRGLRLARDGAVINVVLQKLQNANSAQFFEELEKVAATEGPPNGSPTKTASLTPALFKRTATKTVELLGQPAQCVEYLTGTTKNDRRSDVAFVVHEGKGFVLSLDCAAANHASEYEVFKGVLRSFRIIPVSQQPFPVPSSAETSRPASKESSSPSNAHAGKEPAAPVEKLSDDEIQVMLEASGISEVKREAPDSDETLFKMQAGDRVFGIVNDRKHGQLRCYAFFGAGGESVTLRRLRTVNAWNADNRFAKAFVYDNGNWVLESDLRYAQGTRPEAVMSHVTRFAEAVPRFVKHVEEMLAAN